MGKTPEQFDVDPRTLHLRPTSYAADPFKLQRQIAQFGRSTAGMPPIWVYRGSDGELVVFNGATRAARAAKLSPGTLVRVEVVGAFPFPVGAYPTVGDRLP